MEHIVLVIHLIITLVLIVLILLQRSEGGGLGLGTGGGLGNFASVQSTANALTKTTTYIAAAFFCTSVLLAIMASRGDGSQSILDVHDTPAAVESSATPDAKNTTPTGSDTAPAVPIAK